jgi:predicted alpha-1,6-mannanase (GH76 family)
VTDWAGAAARLHGVLIDRFWAARSELFRIHSRSRRLGRVWHYWWQAHALDALVDAWLRTGDDAHRAMVVAHTRGIGRQVWGRIEGVEHFDDMGWMALAMLRAAETVRVPTDEYVDALAREIAAAESRNEDGGIPWRRGQRGYKNVPATAPAAILFARRYLRAGSPGDLERALRLAEWIERRMVDPISGLVWDGVGREVPGRIDRDWLFTYNQGLVVTLYLDLAWITGDGVWGIRARRTAKAAITVLPGLQDGIWPAEGGGDGGLFKGVLARALGGYVSETEDEEVAASLVRNGDAVLAALSQDGLAGPSWLVPPAPDTPVDLSTHLSALMLLEQLARLSRDGRLPA